MLRSRLRRNVCMQNHCKAALQLSLQDYENWAHLSLVARRCAAWKWIPLCQKSAVSWRLSVSWALKSITRSSFLSLLWQSDVKLACLVVIDSSENTADKSMYQDLLVLFQSQSQAAALSVSLKFCNYHNTKNCQHISSSLELRLLHNLVDLLVLRKAYCV